MQTINKNEIPEILTVKVEKLSNLGLGIARFEGYVIFIEGACPEDILKVRLKNKKKSFAHANIIEIVKPSQYRIEPFCKMQRVCGACQLQFIDYSAQLNFKKIIVEDAFGSIFGKSVKINDVIQSPKIREYRHKIQYPVCQTENSGRILAGYYKSGTHEIVNIKHCPIQPDYCDKIVDFIRINAQNLGISGYNEKIHSGILRHVLIRTSAFNRKNLVTLVINSFDCPKKIKELAQLIYAELENISGVCVNFNSKKTNLIQGEKTELLFGRNSVEEKLCDKIFKIGSKTFFQVNPYTADNIFNYVKQYIKTNYNNPTILDAYAGIATFGICLSDIASKVISVEEEKSSIDMAKEVIEENSINNIELFNQDMSVMRDLGVQYDLTVVDPPRKGCTENSLDYILRLTKREIIYVSCNPATLARDVKYLVDKGCKLKSVQPFDMFPHTYHIENVAIIEI